MVEAVASHGDFCQGPQRWRAPFVCKKSDKGGGANPFILNGKHGGHFDWDGLFTVWEVTSQVRKRNVRKREGRAQDIGFPLAIKEVWERQEGVRGSVLEQEGGFRERVVGKPTV